MPLEFQPLGAPLFSGDVAWADLAAVVGQPVTVVLTTFAAGAGTAWHHHDHPQVLVVGEGRGVLEFRDGALHELAAGAVRVVPPGAVHRHAAAPDAAMTHVSVSARQDTALD
ncbi:cupin domain-containing protein [Kineococcus rhizosphaerae]|uniref:Cupin domain-containing protein n=1 Tax=Kineococcus rhizosphaerae TaxID=559628 RepID=A0A2T0R6F2_9ACTN|nr:cupin domain-containing protein [Kineococcus rhizosphaerae]PRY16736.1 Cupin domain-containing protein [Kineococcus rhizosphaerae]